MQTVDHPRATRARTIEDVRSDPAAQACWLLRLGFTVAPILFGLDKFFDVLAEWTVYLAPSLDRLIPGSANDAMLAVGAIEIVAGVLVALKPRIGGVVVAAWLAGIIINLMVLGDFYDIALRDFGLLLGALTLSRLASVYEG